MTKPTLGLLLSLALFVGCGDDDGAEEAPAASAEPVAPEEAAGPSMTGEVGGVGWEAPEPFLPVQPSGRMRDAEYVFPEAEGEPGAATLTVFFFGEGVGGSVRENVSRWVGQFRSPPGEQAQIEEQEVEGLPVTLLDVRGTYNPQMGPGRGGPPQPNQRMLGAIVEGSEGPVFFKMVGPEAVMERAKPVFDRLVASFHPRG